MPRFKSIRALVGGVVALVLVVGVGISQARSYAGVHVKGHTFHTGPGASDVQIRFVCPPQTQSTPRPGDFSFCTGNVTVTSKGRVVAKGPISIRTFDSHLEHLPTTAAGRKVFKPGKRVTVHWSARTHDGRGRYAGNGGNVVVVR